MNMAESCNVTDMLSKVMEGLHVVIDRLDDETTVPDGPTEADVDRQIKVMKEMRHFTSLRNRKLGADLFSDAGWHMLMDLYYNHLLGREMNVTDACVASGAPYTTGLRWLNILIERGLARRERAPVGARNIRVTLTEKGVKAMDGLFRAFC